MADTPTIETPVAELAPSVAEAPPTPANPQPAPAAAAPAATPPAGEPAAPAPAPPPPPPQPSFKERWKNGDLGPFATRVKFVADLLYDAGVAIRFPNKHVRQISALFIVSFIALLVTGAKMFIRLKDDVKALPYSYSTEDAAKLEKEEIDKRREEIEHQKSSTADLGRFMADLRAIPGTPKGFNNRAEMQLFIECDSPATREYVEGRAEEFREIISNVFSSVDRETLLTREGKRQVMRLLIDRINRALPKGKTSHAYLGWLKIG